MIINKKTKTIFLEVPHTGSTFVRNNLLKSADVEAHGDGLKRHQTVHQYNIENVKQYDIFYMTRHPEDRMLSFYYESMKKDPINDRFSDEEKSMNLNDFISYSFENIKHVKFCVDKGSLYKHYDPVRNSTALKFEDFENSIGIIFDAFGIDKPDTSVRINEHTKTEKINRHNRGLINMYFDYDFQTYNYYKRNKYSTQ